MWENLLFNLLQIGLTVSLVALIPIALRRVLKKRYPARVMCLVWALLAIRLLIPVQLTLPEPPVQVTPRVNYVRMTQPQAVNQKLQQIEPAGRWMTAAEAEQYVGAAGENSWIRTYWGNILFYIWLLGMALFVFRQWRGYLRFRQALNEQATDVKNPILRAVFEEEKQSLGIAREIPLLVSGAADCPMLAGFARPAIFLPDESLSAPDAAFIFRHELTHCKRGDLWLKLLLVLARAMQWFNPLVHLMARFAYEDIELACDDAVAKEMDGAERRAYGEAILRSAVAQAKRRVLVSCFTGDKKTLMRRFEGLFDTRVKKRGVALVVAVAVLVGTLGCAFSVRAGSGGPEKEEMLRLAAAVAVEKQQSGYTRYTVVPEEDTALLILAREDETVGAEPRVAERLYFEKNGNSWSVARSETVATKADSLETFRMLYENDLGLPDHVSESDFLQGATAEVIREWDATGNGEDDMAETRYTFADGSVVIFVGGDWTAADGTNNRTAADLTQQFARAVSYKSVWPLYPVLPNEGQALANHQRRWADSEPGGVWYSKFGGSSPTFDAFVIVPTEDPNACIAVFQGHGGGTTDFRTAVKVIVGKENGRSVITGFEEYDTHLAFLLEDMDDMAARITGLTRNELFDIYYNSGLPWPTAKADIPLEYSYNSGHYADLAQPLSAAETVFGYFGEWVTKQTENGADTSFRSWLAGVELLSQTASNAVVRLTFDDGSGSVDIGMQKAGDYWLPTGLVDRFDESFHAWIDGKALPTGATVEEAVAAAAGDIPILPEGVKIKLEPLDGKAAPINATVTDAVVREDGALQYDERVTEHKEIQFAQDGSGCQFVVEPNFAELLASTIKRYTYRGITVRYEAEGTRYTASFVFRTENENAPVEEDHSISSATYYDPTYGYTLTLPESFLGRGYLLVKEGLPRFGLQYAMGKDVENETDYGAIMWLNMDLTAALYENFGENWEANYPVPCTKLAERDGLTYFLAFASDVQYDTHNSDIAAAYQTMRRDAARLGPQSLSFASQTEAQKQACKTLRLKKQGEQYMYSQDRTAEGLFIDSWEITPEPDANACTVRVQWSSESGEKVLLYTAERVYFQENGEIARTEPLGDSRDGVTSSADFLTLYRGGSWFPTLSTMVLGYAQTDLQAGGLDTPEHAADTVLGTRNIKWSRDTTAADEENVTLTGKLSDGPTLRLNLRRIQLTTERPAIYVPDDWSLYNAKGETIGMLGRQYSPYDVLLAEAVDYYPYRDTNELLWYLDMGWADPYTDDILAELDRRYASDPEEVDDAVDASIDWSGNSALRELWEAHKKAA